LFSDHAGRWNARPIGFCLIQRAIGPRSILPIEECSPAIQWREICESGGSRNQRQLGEESNAMDSHPVWLDSPIPPQSHLTSDQTFDVVVVGGGITGLTAAYLLQLAGFSGCILERDRLGMGDSGCTTAHLTYVTDTRLPDLVRRFGHQSARLLWAGGAAAIETIESIVNAELIPCDFHRVPGFLHVPCDATPDEDTGLAEDFDLARELGFAAHWLKQVPVMATPGIRFAYQGQFHPLKYLRGLAQAITSAGWKIYEHAEVTGVYGQANSVNVGEYNVTFKNLVLATHVPLAGKSGLISATYFQSKLIPYSTYALRATAVGSRLPAASFWDTANPYNYLRIEPATEGRQALIYGGEDHKTGQEEDPAGCHWRLEQRLRQLFPDATVDHRWSGQVIETHDGLPYVGATADHQYIATGFAGTGLTMGTLGAMVICDRILGNESPWQDLLDVNRPPLRGGMWSYLKENFDYPYYLLKDRFGRSDAIGDRELQPGEGQVLRVEGQWVARSCDTHGDQCAVSAVCPHMGCLVRWNGAEKTWDCPCHGSRFTADGEVHSGPAEKPLEQVEFATDRTAMRTVHLPVPDNP
jgi:glycine/D-amino acid oxidase-like deaminating enzyme/nitrite reductase/ring-hydroxylating ferredoxin subunit